MKTNLYNALKSVLRGKSIIVNTTLKKRISQIDNVTLFYKELEENKYK